MGPWMKKWGNAMARGDEVGATIIVVEQLAPVLENTSWFL